MEGSFTTEELLQQILEAINNTPVVDNSDLLQALTELNANLEQVFTVLSYIFFLLIIYGLGKLFFRLFMA